MGKILFAFAIAALCFCGAAGASFAETLNEMYPGPWHEDTPIGISRALVKNNVRNCGEYYYKPSAKNANEFLLYCTRDGKNWNSYLVWDSIGKVMGPYGLDPTVSKPY